MPDENNDLESPDENALDPSDETTEARDTVGAQLVDAQNPETDDISDPLPSTDEPPLGSQPTDFDAAPGDSLDEPGDPTVPADLLELHMELEAQGKTAEDLADFHDEEG